MRFLKKARSLAECKRTPGTYYLSPDVTANGRWDRGFRRWALGLVLALALCQRPLDAAWDPTKPAASTNIVSSEIRDNWVAIAQAVGAVNLLADPTFRIWSAGDSSAPDHYSLSGASAAIARTGTGLGDTTRKVGAFAAKVTSGGGATATLEQQLLSTTSYDDHMDGQTVSAGAWVWTATASAVRICIADGVSSTCSSFHAGNSAWSWLTATRTIDAAATKVAFQMTVASGTLVGYLSGPTVVIGPVPPSYFQPAPVTRRTYYQTLAGNCATGTAIGGVRLWFQRPAIVLNTRLRIGTAPTTQAVIVDINRGGTTMYSTRPQIAAAGIDGQAAPDTTYSQRCFPSATSSALTWDIDQCGSGTVGADLTVAIDYLEYARPLESFLANADIN